MPHLTLAEAMAGILQRLVLSSICVLAAGLSVAEESTLRVSVSVDDDDGIVALNTPVTFTANIRNLTNETIQAKLNWTVQTVAFVPHPSPQTEVTLDAKQEQAFAHQITMPAAGFAELVCEVLPDGADEPIIGRFRIGAEVESISCKLTRKNDFDQFWQESLAELKAVDPAWAIVKQPEAGTDKLDVYEVTMTSFGDVRVRGWLETPKKDGPHPVVIRVPGYGDNMKPVGKWDDMIVFSFNPRGHGNSVDDVPGEPVDYWIRGLDDKSTYYYRGAYLDCVRAVDYVCSRPDVDQGRIAIWGGSQGGGFSFSTAALDPRVDFCAADVPFLCDWVNYFKLTRWPEIDEWIAADEKRSWMSMLETLSYFDTMNMAERIKCPTVMGVGLQDQVCPPTTNFNAFNRISTRKLFRMYRNKGHGMGSDHEQWMWDQIRTEFGLSHPDG